MAKSIVVVGYGPGVSTAVANKFGAEGFSVALIARNKERLLEGVAAMKKKDIATEAFVADANDPASIRKALQDARGTLGPTHVIHWNAYGGAQAGDLLATDPLVVRSVFDVAIAGLLAAVQAALPDLKATSGAVLVTNGAFGDDTEQMDQMAVGMKTMGVALANAAKRKFVGLLSARLRAEGVYVGEVTIAGGVKGTPFGRDGGIEGSVIADRFFELYRNRSALRARVS